MSCALTRRNCSSPHDRFDDDCHSSISICDKLLSIPNGLSGRIGSKLRRLDLKLGRFLVQLTSEIEKVQQSQSRTQCGWSREKEGDSGYRERPRHRQHHPHRTRSRDRSRSRYNAADDRFECRTIGERPHCSTDKITPRSGSRRIIDEGCTGCEHAVSHSSDGLITTPFIAPLRFPVCESTLRLSSDRRDPRYIGPPRPATQSISTLWQKDAIRQTRCNSQSLPYSTSTPLSPSHISTRPMDHGRRFPLPSQKPTTSRSRTRSSSGPAINPDTGLPFRLLPAPRDIPRSLLRSCLEFTGHNPNRVAFIFDESQTARLRVPKRPMRIKKTKTSKTSKKTQNSRDRPPGPIPDISLPVTSAQLRAFSDDELEFFNKLTKDCSSEAKESVQKAKDHHRDWMKETSGH